MVFVSILVLMNLPFLQKYFVTLDTETIGFQSLFLWIFRSYTLKELSQTDIDTLSFNPCSYGSFVLTKAIEEEKQYGIYVSILVLMDLSFLQKSLDIIADMLVKFQSLFLWIFRSY